LRGNSLSDVLITKEGICEDSSLLGTGLLSKRREGTSQCEPNDCVKLRKTGKEGKVAVSEVVGQFPL